MSGVERFPHIKLCTHKNDWHGLVKRLDFRDPEFFHTVQGILVHQAEADDIDVGSLQREQVFVLQKKPCYQYRPNKWNDFAKERILYEQVNTVLKEDSFAYLSCNIRDVHFKTVPVQGQIGGITILQSSYVFLVEFSAGYFLDEARLSDKSVTNNCTVNSTLHWENHGTCRMKK